MRIEIIIDRDPDNDTGVSVFIDGEPADDKVEITTLDPGKGWLLGEWRESVESDANTASPAAADLIRELGEGYETSQHVWDR